MAAAALLLIAARGGAVELSSANVRDIHELVGETLPDSTTYLSLSQYPEHLAFKVSWGLLGVGKATLSVEKVVDFNGRPAYSVVSTARSNAFCSAFYKVRDVNESWIDAMTLDSLGFSKKLREGHFYRDEWVAFDYEKGRFLSGQAGRDGNYTFKGGTIPVSVQDILSSMYFIRSFDLKVGNEIILDVNTRDNWPLVVKVVKKKTVKTPAGKFKTVMVEPFLRREGLFIKKGKRLRLWLTDDDRKMLVMMKVRVFFGHITAKLIKFE